MTKQLFSLELVAVLVTLSVFAVATGLSYPLLAVILEGQGLGATVIGLNTAMTPLGIILSAPFIPGLTRLFGAVRLALTGALLTVVLFLLIGALQNVGIWFLLRFLLGVSINSLYILSETWINQLSSDANRGRVMGLYSTVLAAGFAFGPLVLGLVGSEGWPPFLIGAGAILLAVAVLFRVRSRLPAVAFEQGQTALSFLPSAPLLLAIVAVAAFFDQATLALFPVYGLQAGLTERVAAFGVSVLIAGNIVLQTPLGWVADKLPRRSVIAACGVLVTGGCLALPFVVDTVSLLFPLLFVWGALAYGVYTVALAELGDRFKGGLLLSGNAAFALMWGLGGMAGPFITGGFMDTYPVWGLPLSLGCAYSLLTLTVLVSKPPSAT